jgi:F0F1-type ATP synthase alpha subunit
MSPEVDEDQSVLVGEVISVKDGVAFVTGLPNIRVGEMVQFLNKSKNIFGMALNLETDQVGIIVLVMI